MHEIEVLGIQIQLAQSVINMWYIMAAVTLAAIGVNIYIRRGMRLVPESKFQLGLEAFVEFIYNISKSTMGEKNKGLAPYIGSLGILLFLTNMSALYGFKKIPTTDYSVALGFAVSTFFVVQYHQWQAHKAKGYFKEMVEPFAFFFPLKVLEKITPVLSLSLRLFGNITAGVIIIELAYEALRNLSVYAMAFLPVPLHFYFDIFDGGLQAAVFVILTMEFVANATALEH